jgi:hypothetical protein
VGKVGTESPTFIEPVAQRKDGIKAMFAKQTTSPTKYSINELPQQLPPSPSARKRKHEEASMEERTDEKMKLPKVEKVDAWEDDNNIEYLDQSPTTSKVRISVFSICAPLMPVRRIKSLHCPASSKTPPQ